MTKFAQVLDEVRQEHEAVRRAWSRGEHASPLAEEGERRVGGRERVRTPEYTAQLLEAARFLNDIYEGRRSIDLFREAMTTDDFPLLFGDILDKEILGGFRETPRTFESYFRVNNSVRDFRERVIFALDGGEGVLDEVKERSEYPEAKVDESEKARYAVKKYGRRFSLSFETKINDDLSAFRALPSRLGRAARRSEEKFATQQFVDANGPHATVFSVANENLVTGEPPLSTEALRVAMGDLAGATDQDGEPIFIETLHLVVPPALEVTANNILNALQMEITEVGGTANQKLIVANWVKNRLRLHVNYYIPNIASTANGDTSWFLIGDPAVDRPFAEFGRLRGHAEPEIFVKESNARRIGGGTVDPEEGDFDTDAINYKVRHIFGAVVVEPKVAIASNGTA